MAIRADASQLKSRLRRIAEATRLAPYALSTVAQDTIGDVSDNAVIRLAGREDQVGFNLIQFLDNIREPGAIQVSGARGSIGILNTERMGTVGDFEAIAGDPSLWHTGRRAGEAFRLAVFNDPEIRDELARDRQSVWGAKTPQWYLLENGTLGIAGAYPQAPPAHFIASATRADRIALKLYNAMASLFKGISRR